MISLYQLGVFAANGFIAFVLVAAATPSFIRFLKSRAFAQKVYEDAPVTHAVKTGTPTMGGVLFAIALLYEGAYALFFRDPPRMLKVVELVSLGLCCAAIGYVDDIASIRRRRNKGLGAREKFVLTAAIAIAFLVAVALAPGHVPLDRIAFGAFAFEVPVWLWFALGFAAIVSTTHAVNLTDGLDGLAAGTIVPPLVLFAVIASTAYDTLAVGSVDFVTLGSVLAFLIYNRHPAKVFMGDTGSLLLGGVLAGSAIMLDQQILLLLVGGVFVAEALSVIVQVAYFKRSGKRIFRMSPLHHHFELSGWPETRVTTTFWFASLVLTLGGFAALLLPKVAS